MQFKKNCQFWSKAVLKLSCVIKVTWRANKRRSPNFLSSSQLTEINQNLRTTALDQCFSNFNMHMSYLGTTLKYRFCFRRVWGGAWVSFVNKLLGDVNTADQWTFWVANIQIRASMTWLHMRITWEAVQSTDATPKKFLFTWSGCDLGTEISFLSSPRILMCGLVGEPLQHTSSSQ